MRILVTESGKENTLNLCINLREIFNPKCTIIGVNSDEFEMENSNADKDYLVPRFDSDEYLETIEHILIFEEIYFMIPNNKLEIKTIVESDNSYIKSHCFQEISFIHKSL